MLPRSTGMLVLLLMLGAQLACGLPNPLAAPTATPLPPPTPTAAPTPIPASLTEVEVLSLVADELRPTAHAFQIRLRGQAIYVGQGEWRVRYEGGVWAVFEAGYRVQPLNETARRLEADQPIGAGPLFTALTPA